MVRSVSPEHLPDDAKLPSVDVFICTADHTKEPTVEVMNTVISAMGLDYPAEKLAVYLSDDGGAASTLFAMKEACSFAKTWLPFCRQFGIKTRCPEAYFSLGHDEFIFRTDEFEAKEEKIKSAYEMFKAKVENRASRDSVMNDRPPRVEIIHDNKENAGRKDNLPLLVYVSREKRPSRPHRFKAGALNALLRVSGILSNAPYMVVLDCDMYCNDPASAKQAMCFHLDTQISDSLAYVQFPQIFYNVSKRDIYDGQARSAYKMKYQGMDGIRGTICAGTGYYLKKKALYNYPNQEDEFLSEPEKKFGNSSKFIASVLTGYTHEDNEGEGSSCDVLLEEARSLASCTYEENTKWGKEVGYSYDSLLESSFTGYLLHTRGWRSVYLYPKRPAFLGCTTIDMKDAMVQLMKWSSGLLQVGLSKFSPLVYGMARMPILQSMCYGYFMFMPLLAIACVLYGVVPQLCLLNGISLFPQVTTPWFSVFAIIYISSTVRHLYEVLSTGGSLVTWWNETRIFFIKSVSALLFGCLDVVMKSLGVAKASFRLTNKAVDQEKLAKYEKGTFDFEGAKMFMIPLTVLVLLNTICFIGGVGRVISNRNIEEMFGQVFLSSSTLLFSYPILKGLIPSKSK